MRSHLIAAATLLFAAGAASPDAAAQQSFPPPPPAMTEPAPPPAAAKATKKGQAASAKPRHVRYAALRQRVHSPCEIIDGWRAFPTRDRRGFFDTRRACRGYLAARRARV
jgi:hypothetical protein